MTDQVNCPNCGAAVTAGARFCAGCGNVMPVAAPPAAPTAAPARCASCGAELRAGMRFCAGCGAAAAQAPQPAAMAAAPAGAVCASCGGALAPAAKFCRACGTPVGAAPAGWQQWTPPPAAAKKQSPAIWAALAVVVVAVAAVAAYFLFLRDDGDKDGTPASGGSGGSSSSAKKTPGAQATTASGKSVPAAQAELADMTMGLAEKTFKVVYEIKGTESVSKASVQAQLTLVSAPPRVAVTFDAGSKGLDLTELFPEGEGDITFTGGGALQVFSLIYDGKQSAYLCVKMVGQPGQCQLSETDPSEDEGESLDIDTALTDLVGQGSEDEARKVEEVKGQKIAGRDTKCYLLTRKEETPENKSDVAVTICIDKQEGLPLLIEGKGTGEGTLDTSGLLGEGSLDTEGLPGKVAIEGSIKAKSVAFKVSDSDFKPPYEIVEELD